jgi:hypothetical protein
VTIARGGGPYPLVVPVLFEALKKFGRIDEHNSEQVARWVRRRMAELQAESEPVDAKARAAGE